MRAHAQVHHIAAMTHPSTPPMQGTLERWLPRRESRLMSEEAVRTNGVFLPYPLLGIMLTLVLALGGGIIGMYVKVDTMSSVILMRDADQREQVKKLENKLDLQEMYIRDIRETLAARGELRKGKS